jgi:hypothetical protein
VTGEVELCLKLDLSVFISASVDESEPLTRRAVGQLLLDYMRQHGVDPELLIDRVTIEEVTNEALNDQTPPEELVRVGLICADVLGPWSTTEAANAAASG